MAAQVLQALMAVRAQHVIGLNGVTAVGAFAIVHELALLEGHLELLLVTVDLQQGGRSRQYATTPTSGTRATIPHTYQ